jgi:glycosyltransferase involved in cell wall biosynthesis
MRELDIEDSTVVVNKRVSHSEMPALYQAADVTLVPSREGFGLVYLESMACGVPVVGVSEGASVEVVGDKGGVLVPPGSGFEQRLGEALVRLEADAAHRQTLGRSGYHVFVENHNTEQWVERLEAILSAAFHR